MRMCACGKVAINLRGMEYLQAQAGEDEDTAWKRLRLEAWLIREGSSTRFFCSDPQPYRRPAVLRRRQHRLVNQHRSGLLWRRLWPRTDASRWRGRYDD